MSTKIDTKAEVIAGVRAAVPMAIPVLPFGLILGYLISESAVSNFAGWSGSWLIFAGSSQLVALELLEDGSNFFVIVAAIAMINARHIMYSAALNAKLRSSPTADGYSLPNWFRLLGSYVMVDQAFAIADSQPVDKLLKARVFNFLGAGIFFWTVWQTSVALGVFAGDVIPSEWSLDFSPALLFAGLLVAAVRNQPAVVAAVVAAVLYVGLSGLPPGGGLLIAIVGGAAAAGLFESLRTRRASGEVGPVEFERADQS